MLEAVCLGCGQTVVVDDKEDEEHFVDNETGQPCGGKLVRTGGWVMKP